MAAGAGGLASLLFEALTYAVLAVLIAAVPYVRRKRGHWTGRGVRPASGLRALAATLPGVRLDDRTVAALYRDEADAVLGLHDGGRPCALARDVRVAAAAMSNDGFADAAAVLSNRRSLVPSAVDAQAVVAVLPTMAECAAELITSLEAVANRRLTVAPWTEVRQCAATVVATCVYGQPMIHSRVKTFAEHCYRTLSSSSISDYFAGYDLSSSSSSSSTNFKELLMAAAADNDDIGAGEYYEPASPLPPLPPIPPVIVECAIFAKHAPSSGHELTGQNIGRRGRVVLRNRYRKVPSMEKSEIWMCISKPHCLNNGRV